MGDHEGAASPATDLESTDVKVELPGDGGGKSGKMTDKEKKTKTRRGSLNSTAK